jgi:hypothetical protein
MNVQELELKVRGNGVYQMIVNSFRKKDKPTENEFEFINPSLKLIGGAVLDILEGRRPKDYDIVGWDKTFVEKLKELGFKYQYDSKTAKTFKKDEIIIQLLKNGGEDFDYTISQTAMPFTSKSKLEIDLLSFESKTLCPTETSFSTRRGSINALRRVLHYRSKGYKLEDITYLSLLGVVGQKEYSNNQS